MERINTQVSCVISNPISAHSLKTKKKMFFITHVCVYLQLVSDESKG